MGFDVNRLRKSVRRVTKCLRKNSRRPGSDEVHKLRTSIRTLETTFRTLGMNSKASFKGLLRDLSTIRKRAGKVRDMDVLTAGALLLEKVGEQDCLVQLIEQLGVERKKSVKKLRRAIAASNPQLVRTLKRKSGQLEKLLKQAADTPDAFQAVPMTMAKTLQLSAELNEPVRLNRSNLHSYRLQVKELRDVLQLSDHIGDPGFLEKLGEVKDAIGEWHDWEELIGITRSVLDHGPSCKLLKHMKTTSDSKYERALFLTKQLRSKYLGVGGGQAGGHHGKPAVGASVLRATSAIAEQ